jgi:hypothetical protein
VGLAWLSWTVASRLNAGEPLTYSPAPLATAAAGELSDQCADCGCVPQSVWTETVPDIQFTLDLLILDRSDADAGPLFFDAQTFQPLLDHEDLLGPAQPGVRMGLLLLDDCGWDLEFGYLGLDRFGDQQTRSSDNGILFPFFGGIPANPQDTYTARYISELNSGEVNLRRRYNSRLAVLAGLRFLELNERFQINSDSGGFRSLTDNDLYGLQVGADVKWLRIRRSVLFSTIKSGIYYNNADVSARAQSNAGLLAFEDDEDEAAWVGELAAGLLIPMGPQADLRIGYQGLWLDGVGLAPDQSDNYSIFTGSGSLDQTTVSYHGGFVGIDLFY